MTEPRKVVLDLRAKAPMWRIPGKLEQEIVRTAPRGWTVEIVPADTVSDGDGGHPPSPESIAAIADAEIYYAYGITPTLFAAAKKLRWVHTATAGVGSVLFPELVASSVVLTNSAGVHAVPMAEYVLAGLLHFWRGFDLTLEAQRASTWEREDLLGANSPAREAGESTVLIVGAGGIGQEVATRLSALGTTCIGIRRRPEAGTPPGFARIAGMDELDALLPTVDAIVLGMPLTPQTRNLMSAERLDRLQPHAVVVNVARGAVIDEEALIARLMSGRIRGAVLDVFQKEPLASDSPLWQLRRALVTPHISPVTPRRFWERQAELFLDNFRRYNTGEPLRNVVNKDAGY